MALVNAESLLLPPRIAHKLLPSHLPAALLLPWRCCRRKGGKRKGTGVKYDDVAGIDHIKSDVKEVRFRAKGASRRSRQLGGVALQLGCREAAAECGWWPAKACGWGTHGARLGNKCVTETTASTTPLTRCWTSCWAMSGTWPWAHTQCG